MIRLFMLPLAIVMGLVVGVAMFFISFYSTILIFMGRK